MYRTNNKRYGNSSIYTRDVPRTNAFHNNMCALNRKSDFDLYFHIKNDYKLADDMNLWKYKFENEYGNVKGNIILDNFISLRNNKNPFEYYMFKRYNNKILYLQSPVDHEVDSLDNLYQFIKQVFTNKNIDHLMSIYKTKLGGFKIHYKANLFMVKNRGDIDAYISKNKPTVRFHENCKLVNIHDIGRVDSETRTLIYNQEFYTLVDYTAKGLRFNIVGLKDSVAFNHWYIFLCTLMDDYFLYSLS